MDGAGGGSRAGQFLLRLVWATLGTLGNCYTRVSSLHSKSTIIARNAACSPAVVPAIQVLLPFSAVHRPLAQ